MLRLAPLVTLALFATGAFAATHYPLVKAQAYRALPGRSGTVNAVLTLFGVTELVVPVALGLVAAARAARARPCRWSGPSHTCARRPRRSKLPSFPSREREEACT